MVPVGLTNQEFAAFLCKEEGLKEQVNIAQMCEIVKILARLQATGFEINGVGYTPSGVISGLAADRVIEK